MASMIPESFANSFAANVYGAGLSASQGALMAQYQMDEYQRRAMSSRQQAMMENQIRQELEQQICEQVKKNIKVEKTVSPTDSYATNNTAIWAGAPIYYTSAYDGVFPTEKPEPKPKKIAKKALSFYEDLKAEIEGWLQGALDFAY